MMLKVWLYAFALRVTSTRRLERRGGGGEGGSCCCGGGGGGRRTRRGRSGVARRPGRRTCSAGGVGRTWVRGLWRGARRAAMMLKVWLYGFALRVTSTRRLERRVREDLAFRYLAGGLAPDHKTLSEFLRRHRRAINDLFTQVVQR